jgi:23S rRNA (guanosine2251-2'-O)-methyltransferase
LYRKSSRVDAVHKISTLLVIHKMNKKLKLWELDRVSDDEFKAQEKFPLTVILNDIRSLTNVGSFFRTCDAFNIDKLYLCGITATPPHREIQKTALGATESMEWEHCESAIDLVNELKADGVTICSIEQTEKTTLLQDVGQLPEKRFALVLGNEVNGVDQDIIDASDYIIEIPQFGTKHSLNVSVCAGIVMWEFTKRFV